MTTYFQCTGRTDFGINQSRPLVQASITPVHTTLNHFNQSFRCISHIHTVGIDLVVRYQCCHGWTSCSCPQMAHLTTLICHPPTLRDIVSRKTIEAYPTPHKSRGSNSSFPTPPVAGFAHVLAMGGLLGYYVTPLPVMAVVTIPNVCHGTRLVDWVYNHSTHSFPHS